MIDPETRVSDPDSIRSADADPYSESGSGSSRGQKLPTKVAKNFEISCSEPLLRAEGFFCNLDVLYGGIGIGNM
jgi:hypothetical protein